MSIDIDLERKLSRVSRSSFRKKWQEIRNENCKLTTVNWKRILERYVFYLNTVKLAAVSRWFRPIGMPVQKIKVERVLFWKTYVRLRRWPRNTERQWIPKPDSREIDSAPPFFLFSKTIVTIVEMEENWSTFVNGNYMSRD